MPYIHQLLIFLKYVYEHGTQIKHMAFNLIFLKLSIKFLITLYP